MNWYATCALSKAKRNAVDDLRASMENMSKLVKESKLNESAKDYFEKQILEIQEAMEQLKQ